MLLLDGWYRFLLLHNGFGSLKLYGFETEEEHWLFIIVDSHASIILIVVLPLKQCNPLFIGSQTTHENDMLRDRNRPNHFSLRFAGNLNLVFTQFRLQWHVHVLSLSALGNLERFENALAETDLKVDFGAVFKR